MNAPVIAPTIGATKNSHNWLRAAPPASKAGPKLRAGLTDVPVIGMPTIWITVSAQPIAIPAKPALAVDEVAPSITTKKNAVKTASAINAGIIS